MLKFRTLKAEEIDVRVNTVSEKGCSLLLYKDARCDMNILDETVGSMNWQRSHLRDNANCIVSIYDYEKKEWVSKEDVGTKSNSEPEKGLASDSFKRACTNWGIGRELYTAPFIWVTDVVTRPGKNGKLQVDDKFAVADIAITDGVITGLAIANTGRYGKGDKIVYIYGDLSQAKLAQNHINALRSTIQQYVLASGRDIREEQVARKHGFETLEQFDMPAFKKCMDKFNKLIKEAENNAQ